MNLRFRTISFYSYSNQFYHFFQTSLSTYPISNPSFITLNSFSYFPSNPSLLPIYFGTINKQFPDNIKFSNELENFITLQQQLQYPHTLAIHQLSSTVTSLNPPTPTPISDYTPSLAQPYTSTESSTSTNQAYRIFKRKYPNHQFPSKPRTARENVNHPDHTNTANYLQVTLPLFPQYTLNQSEPNPEPHSFVDEHVLIPTLHWIAYYNYTNTLSLPLHNTTQDIERNKSALFRLTTSLTPRQFTYIGFEKLLKSFTTTRANDYSI